MAATAPSCRHSRRVVLAYSGGLDTITILTWLMERGWEVVAFIADVGQKEDFTAVAEGTRRDGAVEAVVADHKRDFVTEFVFPAVAGNAVYESRYLLGTTLARPLIARRRRPTAHARHDGRLSLSAPVLDCPSARWIVPTVVAARGWWTAARSPTASGAGGSASGASGASPPTSGWRRSSCGWSRRAAAARSSSR